MSSVYSNIDFLTAGHIDEFMISLMESINRIQKSLEVAGVPQKPFLTLAFEN